MYIYSFIILYMALYSNLISHVFAEEASVSSQENLFTLLETILPAMETIKLKYWPGNEVPDYIVPVPSIIFDPLKAMVESFTIMMQTMDKASVDKFKLYCHSNEPVTKFKLLSYLPVFRDWLKHDVFVNDTITFDKYREYKPEAKEFLEDLYVFYNKGFKIWLMMYGVCEALCNRPSNPKTIRFYLDNVKPFVDDMLYVIHDMKIKDEQIQALNSTQTTMPSA